MNSKKVLKQLKDKYSDKKIFENNGEIICEIESSCEHSEYSLAIAVIDKSKPHFHKKTKEKYRVIKGELKLFIEDEVYSLSKGEEVEIPFNKIHWAQGSETWVECFSKPGWNLEDHIFE